MQRRASTPERSGKIPPAMAAHQNAGSDTRPPRSGSIAGWRHELASTPNLAAATAPARSPTERGPLGCGVCSEAAGACLHGSAPRSRSDEWTRSRRTVKGRSRMPVGRPDSSECADLPLPPVLPMRGRGSALRPATRRRVSQGAYSARPAELRVHRQPARTRREMPTTCRKPAGLTNRIRRRGRSRETLHARENLERPRSPASAGSSKPLARQG
jgi:hypothetical protein